MSDKYHSGSDMYKKHRDLIASIMEQAEKFEDEIDHVEEIDESADHPEDCRCKMCKPSIYEGENEFEEVMVVAPEEKRSEISSMLSKKHIDHHMTKGHDHNIVFSKPKNVSVEEFLSSKGIESFPYKCDLVEGTIEIEESGKDFIEKAKKEIEEESDLAHEVAEEHGQMLDNVAHMSWFIQEVADKLKDQEPLDEAMRGVIDSNYELKKHIANNFDFYKDNIMRLYPEDMKNTKEVFLRFLKGQELDQDKLESLSASLEKKIRNTGDAYDEMSQFIELVKRFPK